MWRTLKRKWRAMLARQTNQVEEAERRTLEAAQRAHRSIRRADEVAKDFRRMGDALHE